MNIDFKIGHRRARSFDEQEPRTARCYTFGLSGAAFASLLVSAAGVGASVYGANKNAKSQAAAAAANTNSQAQAQANDWQRYGLTRGVDFNTGNPVNSRLPLWANITRDPSGAAKLSVAPASQLAGLGVAGGGAPTGPAKPIGFANGKLIYPPGQDPTATAPGRGNGIGQVGTALVNGLVPGLGAFTNGQPVTIKNVTKNVLDPFGLF